MYIQFQFRSQHQTYLQTKCKKRTSKNESIYLLQQNQENGIP